MAPQQQQTAQQALLHTTVLPETSEYGVDPDCKIAQLRWARGHLVPGYIGFTSEEKTLLFKALCNALGEDNIYYVSKEDANKDPTKYHVSVTPNGHVMKYAS